MYMLSNFMLTTQNVSAYLTDENNVLIGMFVEETFHIYDSENYENPTRGFSYDLLDIREYPEELFSHIDKCVQGYLAANKLESLRDAKLDNLILTFSV